MLYFHPDHERYKASDDIEENKMSFTGSYLLLMYLIV